MAPAILRGFERTNVRQIRLAEMMPTRRFSHAIPRTVRDGVGGRGRTPSPGLRSARRTPPRSMKRRHSAMHPTSDTFAPAQRCAQTGAAGCSSTPRPCCLHGRRRQPSTAPRRVPRQNHDHHHAESDGEILPDDAAGAATEVRGERKWSIRSFIRMTSLCSSAGRCPRPHRHRDMGRGETRRVVHPVADHRHLVPLRAVRLDRRHLALGESPALTSSSPSSRATASAAWLRSPVSMTVLMPLARNWASTSRDCVRISSATAPGR